MRLTDVRAAKATAGRAEALGGASHFEKLAELKSLFGKFPGSCATSLQHRSSRRLRNEIAIQELAGGAFDYLLARGRLSRKVPRWR